MAWLKIDDQFYANQKAVKAFTTDPAALGVWLMCATWSANQMTDGHVPEHLVRMWGVQQEAIDVLVGSGLWLEDATSEGWVMKDFLDYNPSRAELEEKRAKEAARRSQRGGTNATRTQQRGADVIGPVPVPEPVTPLRGVNTRGVSAKEARTRKRLGLEAEGPGGTAA
jgi:hypothetical protein